MPIAQALAVALLACLAPTPSPGRDRSGDRSARRPAASVLSPDGQSDFRAIAGPSSQIPDHRANASIAPGGREDADEWRENEEDPVSGRAQPIASILFPPWTLPPDHRESPRASPIPARPPSLILLHDRLNC